MKKNILTVQIYVDDIVFCSTNATLCKEFSATMQAEFEMSMMRELKIFLGYPNQSIQRWSLCSLIQVYKGASKEGHARGL